MFFDRYRTTNCVFQNVIYFVRCGLLQNRNHL